MSEQSLTQRAYQHNSSAFLAELHTAAAARRMHNDRPGALEIERAIASAPSIENEWTIAVARRFLVE
ncbi:hypothetical protein [Rhizobium sp. Leaf383]|uniref:hypothetical protein n=1 Tax=Rhizobium sp. Leaf383 TaxID=1736357 RepID=UPI00071590C5|nr:hypothetical protein [Rhizobium sp. Leaf383]KQS84309.1 hypothetical protein ASG58_21300 [Rhizobium sp. Leaf383]